MRYLSDDGKVFNTEEECYEYEQKVKAQKIKREKLENERNVRLEAINKKYKELQDLFSEYERDYGVRQRPYIAPFYEIFDMLCG